MHKDGYEKKKNNYLQERGAKKVFLAKALGGFFPIFVQINVLFPSPFFSNSLVVNWFLFCPSIWALKTDYFDFFLKKKRKIKLLPCSAMTKFQVVVTLSQQEVTCLFYILFAFFRNRYTCSKKNKKKKINNFLHQRTICTVFFFCKPLSRVKKRTFTIIIVICIICTLFSDSLVKIMRTKGRYGRALGIYRFRLHSIIF